MSTSMVASVVFLKIGEFARRPATEQARLRAQLEAVIAVTAAELPPSARLVLEASDGAAVVVFRDPMGALRLAQRALTAGAAGLPLCAGLNHGALQLAGDKGAEAMTGDGIAVAASVAEFAGSARLLASRTFREALADAAPGSEASLAPAGTFTDAGLRAHELFTPDDRGLGRRRLRYALAGIALVAAFIGGGIGWRALDAGRKPFGSAVMAKYPEVPAYLRELVQRVSY